MKTNIERHKKMLLVLPVLVIPFVIMLFWALGGGRVSAQSARAQITGLDMQLPGAHNRKDSTENKLTLYEKARKDSLKFNEARKDDPYYHADLEMSADKPSNVVDGTVTTQPFGVFRGELPAGIPNSPSAELAQNERQITLKLASINRQINQPSAIAGKGQQGSYIENSRAEEQLASLQAKLQQVSSQNEPDPQLQQLSDMLDKIADVENPGIAREKLKEESEKKRGRVFSVTTGRQEKDISTLENNMAVNTTGNGFYSLDEMHVEPDSQNTVTAVVATTQTVVSGSTVKLRLTNDIYINGSLIPANTFVYGIAALSGERLEIKISNIRYKHSLYPVSLSVFDLDGMAGVYIPGAITRDVAKESANESIQSMGLMSYNPSLSAQAATAGINAAKSLLTRKVKLVKVSLKAGYQVYCTTTSRSSSASNRK